MSERLNITAVDRLEDERAQLNAGCNFQALESRTINEETKTIDILNEMKQLHEERLRLIDQEAGGDSSEMKVKALKSWIADLEEQNTMLVQILGKLEQEAADRVTLLKEKLQSSALAASKFMESEQDREKLIEDLSKQNELKEKTIISFFNKLQQLQEHIVSKYKQLDKTEEAVKKLQSISEYFLDESIETVISCFDEVLQERQKLLAEVETFKSELSSRNNEVGKLNNRIMEMDESARDMREALAVEVADKHDQIISLRREIHHLEDRCRQADMQTHFKDDIIKEMRKDLKVTKSRLAALELQKQNIFVNDREHILSSLHSYSHKANNSHHGQHSLDMHNSDTPSKEKHKVQYHRQASSPSKHSNSSQILTRSDSEESTPVLLKHHYSIFTDNNPLSFIPEMSEHSRIEDIYYEIHRQDASNQDAKLLTHESSSDFNGKNVGIQLQEVKKDEIIDITKGDRNVVEDAASGSQGSYIQSDISVEEIYTYRYTIRSQEETIRKLEDDLNKSQSAFNDLKLKAKETEVELEDLRLKFSSTNFESSTTSEEDTPVLALQFKLKSSQKEVKTLKDKAHVYLRDLKMAEQNQADCERRIKELKSILEVSHIEVRTALEKASGMNNTTTAFIQEARKYSEGSQEAFKNMEAEINFLMFNLRSHVQQCSHLEEVVSSLDISLETLQQNLSAVQNMMAASMKVKSKLQQDIERYQQSINMLEKHFKNVEEWNPFTAQETLISAVHAHSAPNPNQGALERSDEKIEEFQRDWNRSKDDGVRYREQIQQQEAEISSLQQKIKEADELQDNLYRMKSELQTLRTSMEAKEQIVKDQEEMIHLLQDSVNTAEIEHAELQTRLSILENEKEKALSELEEVEKKAENLQEALLATKKQLEELQGSKFELRIRDCIIQFLHLDLSEAQNQYKNCYGEVVKQERVLDTLRDSNDDLRFEIVNLEQDVGLLEFHLREKFRTINGIKERAQELEKIIKERDEELSIQKYENELMNMTVNDKTKTIEDLYKKLICKDEDLKQMKYLEDQYINMGMKVNMLQKSVKHLEILNTNLEQEIKQHNKMGEVEDLKTKLEAAQKDVAHAVETGEQYQELLKNAAMHEVQLNKDFLERERVFKIQLQSAEAESLQKSNTIENLRSQLSLVKIAFGEKQSEMQAFHEKYECLCKSSQTLEENLAVKEELISELQYSLDNINTKVINMMAQLEYKDAEIENQQHLIKELKDENCDLHKKINFLNSKIQVTETRLSGLMEGNKLLRNVKTQLQKQIKKLENELTALHENISGDHDIVCIESRNTIMRARRWLEEQRRENEELQVKLEDQKRICSNLLQGYHKLKIRVNELEQMNLMLKKSAQGCQVLLKACPGVSTDEPKNFYLPALSSFIVSASPSAPHQVQTSASYKPSQCFVRSYYHRF